MKKISFVGDIMCEKPLMSAVAKYADGDYGNLFEGTKKYFENSDIVIANLETIFAGKEAGYTDDVYSFNTPDSFADALGQSGIDYVTTANNHCLDRGIDGAIRTLDKLDQQGIKAFGTYRNKEERKAYESLNIDGFKIALINYTYGTNVDQNKVIFDADNHYYVNVLRSQKKDWEDYQKSLIPHTFRGKMSKVIRTFTNLEQRMKIKKRLGMLELKPSVEAYEPADLYQPYLDKLTRDIKLAKEQNDYVIVILHSGSLFNPEIGKFTEEIVDRIEKAGVDAIIGHHPHIVKQITKINEMFVAYSLGNYSLSPSSIYVLHEHLPNYGLILNFYVDGTGIRRRTYSIIKMLESEKGLLDVLPVYDLQNKLSGSALEELKTDVNQLRQRVEQKLVEDYDIHEEYDIKVI